MKLQMADLESEPAIFHWDVKVSFGRLSALPAMGSAPKSFLVFAYPILYYLFR